MMSCAFFVAGSRFDWTASVFPTCIRLQAASIRWLAVAANLRVAGRPTVPAQSSTKSFVDFKASMEVFLGPRSLELYYDRAAGSMTRSNTP